MHQAEAALAQARADAEAARAQGSSFAVALALTQAGHALLVLGRPLKPSRNSPRPRAIWTCCAPTGNTTNATAEHRLPVAGPTR